MSRPPNETAPLERPYVRYELMRALATGQKTQRELAALHGVTQSAVSLFATRHKDRIEAIRGKLDDEFAHLWIAGKRARIGVYQGEAERLLDLLEAENDKGAEADRKTITALTRELRATQRNVAEELGDLKTTVAFDSSVLRVEIVAAPEELDRL